MGLDDLNPFSGSPGGFVGGGCLFGFSLFSRRFCLGINGNYYPHLVDHLFFNKQSFRMAEIVVV